MESIASHWTGEDSIRGSVAECVLRYPGRSSMQVVARGNFRRFVLSNVARDAVATCQCMHAEVLRSDL